MYWSVESSWTTGTGPEQEDEHWQRQTSKDPGPLTTRGVGTPTTRSVGGTA